MKSLILASLLALAAAAPCHQPHSKVALRVSTPLPSYRIESGSTQHPLEPASKTIHVVVGQAMSLDHAPLRAQAIEITRITEGSDLSAPARTVAQDDWRVVCRAEINYASDGWIFAVVDGVVGLSEEEPVDITGLECWLEGDDSLIEG